jgi:hypothetical protein
MVSRRLAAVVAGSLVTTMAAASTSAASPTSTPPRVAVAVLHEQSVALPSEFGDRALVRALEQGVRESCLSPGASGASPPPGCVEISDAPGSRVCVDESLPRALSQEVSCGPTDERADVVDLGAVACGDAECWETTARRAGASHLLLVNAEWHDGLAIEGTLDSLVGGVAMRVGPLGSYNPSRPRTGPQVLAIFKWTARDAVVGLLRGERTARATETVVAPATEGSVRLQPGAPAAAPSEARSEARPHRALGWTLLAAGALAGVGSAWLIWDDKTGVACTPLAGDPDPCAKVRRTLIPGIGLGVGAATAMVLGSIFLFEGRSGAVVSISASPRGVALGGRF